MKVLFVDTNHPHLIQGLRALGLQCDEDYASSKNEIENRISDYQGLVIRSRFSIDKSFLDHAS
ncbi:MAG: hydroxyacid dehydrogenase, partial [Lutimonas sp.]